MLLQHLCQHLSVRWSTTLLLLGLLPDLEPQSFGNFQQCCSLVCGLLLSLIVVALQPVSRGSSMLAGLKVGEAGWLDWLRLSCFRGGNTPAAEAIVQMDACHRRHVVVQSGFVEQVERLQAEHAWQTVAQETAFGPI